MNKAEMLAVITTKVKDNVTIANMHARQWNYHNDPDSFRAAMERMGRAFEDVEMAFTMKLITVEEAIQWQQRIAQEVETI